jgi:hypothetical protein
MDDFEEKKRQIRAAELQILFNPNFEHKEELIEFREQLIQELVADERQYQAKNDPEFDMVAFEAQLRSLTEYELLVKKHPCCPSHCCAYHGCKYGYDDCPVQCGQIRQEGLCERCSLYDNVQSVDEAVALSKGAAGRKFLRELSERAAKYNNPAVDAFVASLYAESCIDPATINEVDEDGELCGWDW